VGTTPPPISRPTAAPTIASTPTKPATRSALRRLLERIWSYMRGVVSELDRRGRAGGLVGLEVLTAIELEDLREVHRRELLELVVAGEHGVVVELPRVRHPTLGGRELLLQREEVLVRLEVRVGLTEGEQLPERPGQLVLDLRLRLGRVRSLDGGVAGPDHGVEGLALVGRVPLHRLDEVRDQVEASLQLDVDLGPGVLDLVAATGEPVVGADQ